MPDWSYRTVFQPLLFRLPFETARGLALGSMGRLARLPGGAAVINLMGHMSPDVRLQTDVAGQCLTSPLMLGSSVDPDLTALPAWDQFGFGLIEIGPVGLAGCDRQDADRIDPASATLTTPAEPGVLEVSTALDRLQRSSIDRSRIVVRLAAPDNEDATSAIDEFRRVIGELALHAATFALPLTMVADAEVAGRIARELHGDLNCHDARLMAVVDVDRGEGTAIGLAQAAVAAGAAGVIVNVTQLTPTGEIARGPQSLGEALSLTRALRAKLGGEVPIIAGGGVHEPVDAVRLIANGATMVQIDSGLVFTGPGLPKRINDALLSLRESRVESPVSRVHSTQNTRGTGHSTLDSRRPGRQAWLWTLLMGLAMLIGGVMAMVIAVTRVVMPYDEHFVGMDRSELADINDRLLLFMTHDRVTLAGTMLAVGVLYTSLSWWGIRRGWHWAHLAVIASAFVGFFSFFAFLGFGYFDPLHAFVTVVLFQFLLLGVHSDTTLPRYDGVPNLTNHAAWRRSLWGQLLYVVHGVLLIAAGIVICGYGMTSVFVPEDLEFMQTTSEALCAANPRLVPLVAHDRATFGGMLIACGVTVLLSAMWGYRQGNAWLWWSLTVGGTAAYVATIVVHWQVGYTNLKHLLPAYGGLLLLWVGSTLSRQFLCEIDRDDAAKWHKVIGTDQVR